jgi:hypothetical protein
MDIYNFTGKKYFYKFCKNRTDENNDTVSFKDFDLR